MKFRGILLVLLLGLVVLTGCTTKKSLLNDVNQLRSDYNELKEIVEANKTSSETYDTGLDNKIDSIVLDYTAKVTATKEEYTAAIGELQAAKQEILETIGTIVTNIEALEATDEELLDAIEELDTAIEELRTTITGLETSMNAKCTALNNRINEVNSSIEAVRNSLTTQIQELDAAILELETSLTAAILELETSLTAAILELENDFNQRLADLEEEFENSRDLINSKLTEYGDFIALLKATHTVTLDYNNGEDEPDEVTIAHFGKVTKPVNPSKVGHEFKGWYNEFDELWVFGSYLVVGDMTLTAIYEVNKYIITLSDTQEEIEIEYGKSFTLPIRNQEGYKFLGWYDSEDNLVDQTAYTYVSDQEFTPKYGPLFTITLDSNGGNEIEPIEYHNTNIISLPTPTREGCSFYGWFDEDGKFLTPFNNAAMIDISLTALWVESNDDYSYVVNLDDEVIITFYNGSDEDVRIPSQIDGYDVVYIESSAFENNDNLKKVYISDTVKAIGDNAFRNCPALELVDIPQSVTSIGKSIVKDCNNLKKLSMPFIGQLLISLFDSSEESITIEFDTIELRYVTSTGNWDLFEFFTGITERSFKVVLSEDWVLPEYGFEGCSAIRYLVLPENLSELPKGLFKNCTNLETAYIPYGISVIPEEYFYNCTQLISVVIPVTVTEIAINAFYNCDHLQMIYYGGTEEEWNNIVVNTGNDVLDIENVAFESDYETVEFVEDRNYAYTLVNGADVYYFEILDNNADLEHFDFYSELPGLSIRSISDQGFKNYVALKSIVLPKSIEEVKAISFSGCNFLEEITIESGNSRYDSRDNCKGIMETATNTLVVGAKSTNIPATTKIIGYSAFGGGRFLNGSITIPEGVEEIGDYAFQGAKNLAMVSFPSTLKTIGRGAFSAVNGLTVVRLPNGLETIQYRAFAGCSGMTKIVIPASVTYIGNETFLGCTQVEIYCRGSSAPVGWVTGWNPLNRPVHWNYQL